MVVSCRMCHLMKQRMRDARRGETKESEHVDVWGRCSFGFDVDRVEFESEAVIRVKLGETLPGPLWLKEK